MFLTKSARSDVVIIGAPSPFDERLRSVLSTSGMTVSIRTAAQARLAEDNTGFSFVFVGVMQMSDFDLLRKAAEQKEAGQRLIAIVDDYAAPLVRDVIRFGVEDIVTSLMTDADLLKALDVPRRAAGGPHRVIAFTPVLGGMGATTIAIETAVVLSKGGRVPTCLVDLDFYAGECCDFLNLTPRLDMDVLSGNEARIDDHLLDLVLSDHPSGIKLLAAQTRLGFTSEVNPQAILKLLDVISASYDNVVIDFPRSWQNWSESVITGCDQVFLVTDSTIPALKAARRQLDEVRARFDGRADVKVIVNKTENSLFRAIAGEDDFKRAFGDAYAGSIADEAKTARLAVDSGIPISSVKRSSKIIRNLTSIIEAVIR